MTEQAQLAAPCSFHRPSIPPSTTPLQSSNIAPSGVKRINGIFVNGFFVKVLNRFENYFGSTLVCFILITMPSKYREMFFMKVINTLTAMAHEYVCQKYVPSRHITRKHVPSIFSIKTIY